MDFAPLLKSPLSFLLLLVVWLPTDGGVRLHAEEWSTEFAPIYSSPDVGAEPPRARHSGIASTSQEHISPPPRGEAKPSRSSVTILNSRIHQKRKTAPLPGEMLQPVPSPASSHIEAEQKGSSGDVAWIHPEETPSLPDASATGNAGSDSDRKFAFLPSLPFGSLFPKSAKPTPPTASPPAAGTAFRQKTVGALVFHADFPLSEKETMIEELDRLQQDLTAYLGIPEPAETIQIFLFRDEDGYRQFLGTQFPEAPFRRALYVKKDGPGFVMAHCQKELAVDLRHEMTHAILHASIRDIPLWLDEGLAEYFELEPEQRPHDNPYLPSVKWNAKLGLTPDLEKLESLTHLVQMDTKEYRDAWAWTHFLIHHSPRTHHALAEFLQKKAEGENVACREYLQRNIMDLEKQFLDHFRNWEKKGNSRRPLGFLRF